MPRVGSLRSKSPIGSFEQDDPEYQDGLRPDNDITVDLSEGEAGPRTFEMDSFGDVAPVEQGPPEPLEGAEVHDVNLADFMSEDTLDDIGRQICQWVEDDIEERRPWRDRFQKGLEMLGLVESDIDDGPFPGASNAIHPLLIEAVTQFWARAMAELFPPEGPCKVKTIGAQTQEALARAQRVQEYLNWEMMFEDEGYIPETSRLVWAIPFMGCSFRKTFRDPVMDRTVGVYVPAEDLIVPAEATNLQTAQRFTHRMRKSANDVKRLQLSGFYSNIELDLPATAERDDLEAAKNDASDVAPDDDKDTVEHLIYEMCVEWDLPGFEHIDEEGEVTGLKLPYIISVDSHTQKVLSIYRNWEENDLMCRRKVYIEKFGFVPGLGFYDYGLFHLIGGLQIAATGALRVLLDSAASASLSGGFVSRNANLKGQNLVTQPGVWQPVDASSADLKEAFFPAPVKEPSPALFQLLGFLTEAAQRFTATTELMTGGQDPKGSPVGTTVALIEQGGKVMSTIHRMIHSALGRELRLRFELARKFMPAGGYPYDVSGAERSVYSDDFNQGVEVVPVSDPNIFSSQQRIAIAQSILQLAMQTGAIDMRKAARRVLEAMRAPDIDDLMPPQSEPMPYTPDAEIQAVLMGKPVLVLPEQEHAAHLAVWAAFVQNPGFGGNKLVQQQLMPIMQAVIGQHLAYAWASAARQQGVPATYVDPMSGRTSQPQVPPEQLTALMAQIAPALAQAPGLPGAEPPGESSDQGKLQVEMFKAKAQVEAQQQKAAIDQQAAQQKLEHEREKHQFEIQKEADKLQMEREKNRAAIEQNNIKAQVQIQATQQKGQIEEQRMEQDAQIQQQQAEQQAQLSQQEMQQQAHMGQQKMSLEAQQVQQQGQLKQQQASQDANIKQQSANHDAQLKQQQAHADAQINAQAASQPAKSKRSDKLGKLRGPNG